jgi:hypothetical protein
MLSSPVCTRTIQLSTVWIGTFHIHSFYSLEEYFNTNSPKADNVPLNVFNKITYLIYSINNLCLLSLNLILTLAISVSVHGDQRGSIFLRSAHSAGECVLLKPGECHLVLPSPMHACPRHGPRATSLDG